MTAPVGILLAAGSARRFGAAKLLQSLPDGVAVGVAAAHALRQAVPRVIAVVRPGDQALIDALSGIGLQVVENPLADQGMGASLAAGIRATPDATGWLVALADMPWIQPATLTVLVDRLQQGASLVAPVCQGRRGHPVGFSARWQQPLRALSGDKGARDLLAQHQNELDLINTEDVGVLRDIDHPGDMPMARVYRLPS